MSICYARRSSYESVYTQVQGLLMRYTFLQTLCIKSHNLQGSSGIYKMMLRLDHSIIIPSQAEPSRNPSTIFICFYFPQLEHNRNTHEIGL